MTGRVSVRIVGENRSKCGIINKGNPNYMEEVNQIASKIIACFSRGDKVLAIGNGGSAEMASHFVGELIGKFEKERKPLPAMTLFDLAGMTAIANDLGYEYVFERPLEALGKPGDVLVVFSTSGKSKNCLRAIHKAREMEIDVIEWPHNKGNGTAEIQEYQLKDVHSVCRIVEEAFL